MKIKKFWVVTFALPLALIVSPSATSPAAATDPTDPMPFGHACILESYGVRFCPSATLNDRVPSFDRAPLDVDVTLPASGAGPWPTIIMASPTGSSKTSYETTKASGVGNFGQGYSNVWFANHGYAVVTYSLRGSFGSCGTLQSRQGYPACDAEQFEFGDQRYDARDAQYLLGVLVDQRIADPNALGMTGISLGSIETLEVALLKNRIRLMDGSYAPWTSPLGVPLRLSAAYANASIPDVLDAAIPNGRFLSFDPSTANNDHTPIGVLKLSFASVFTYGTSPASNYWDIPTTPGGFNLPEDVAVAATALPGNTLVTQFANELHDYHQAIGIKLTSAPAPLLVEDGWGDVAVDGAEQALRVANYAKQVPGSNVSLQLLDWGHPLAGGKSADILANFLQATDFFNHYLQGKPGGPAPGTVTAYTATCPTSAPSGGPFVAQGMDALNPGAVRISSTAAQLVASGGNPAIGVGLDPVAAGAGIGSGACQAFPVTDWPGTAVYSQPVAKTFTMLGLPTMRFNLATFGIGGQLNARLWDVAPDGTETYVTRGTYALTDNQTGSVTWQMWGGGHTFPAGHTIRVELLAQDAPTERPSLIPFIATVSNFTIEIPSHDRADGGQIVKPTFTGGW